jgi:hypothetical protein
MIARLYRRFASPFFESFVVSPRLLNTCGKLSASNTEHVRSETSCVDLYPALTLSSLRLLQIPYIARTRATSGLFGSLRALSLVLYSALITILLSVRPVAFHPVIHSSKRHSLFSELCSSQRFAATAEKLFTLFFLHTGSSKLILSGFFYSKVKRWL